MQSPEDLYRQYFRLNALTHNLQWLPLHGLAKKAGMDSSSTTVTNSIRQLVSTTSMDQDRFSALLDAYVSETGVKQEQLKKLEQLVQAESKRAQDLLSAVENSSAKAESALRALIDVQGFEENDQVYDALVLMKGGIESGLVASIVSNWKGQAQQFRDQHDRMPLGYGFFWTSRDDEGLLDAVSRYRFREAFGIGDFDDVFGRVESMVVDVLLEHAIQSPARGAFDLWLVSRSLELSSHTSDAIGLLLRRVADAQTTEGWWAHPDLVMPASKKVPVEARSIPDSYSSSLCSLCLLKLSLSQTLHHQGVRGAQWLLGQQNADGSWSCAQIVNDRLVRKPDLFTTVLSTEALVRSELPKLEHSIAAATSWIAAQQNALGFWEEPGLPFPLLTILVLELQRIVQVSMQGLDQRLIMARGFLGRSMQFALEQNSNSHRLAIIAAFHGVEMFLYAVLSHRTVNRPIFTSGGRQTIGLRRAAEEFREHLRANGVLTSIEELPRKNEVDSLAYYRDEIVHKGLDVTAATCQPLVEAARRFVSENSVHVFGHDLLV